MNWPEGLSFESGLLVWGFFSSVCWFQFLQSFANLTSWDAASSIVWVLDLYSTAGPRESQAFKHHLLPWVPGRNDPISVLCWSRAPVLWGCHTPFHLCVTQLIWLCSPATEWKMSWPCDAKHCTSISHHHRFKLVHHFGRKIWGEDPSLNRWWLTDLHCL